MIFDTASRLFAIIIGILAVVAGLIVGINNPLLSNSAGREGARIDQLFSLTLGLATVVFVLVQGFLLYSIVRFGKQPDDDTDGPIIFENFDPGHQVAGGDDQNAPFRGDDNDGAGSPPLAGAFEGGFELRARGIATAVVTDA